MFLKGSGFSVVLELLAVNRCRLLGYTFRKGLVEHLIVSYGRLCVHSSPELMSETTCSRPADEPLGSLTRKITSTIYPNTLF